MHTLCTTYLDGSQAASVVGCEDCQPRESMKPACCRLGGQCPCCWCKHKLVDLKQAGVEHELTCVHCQAAGAQRRGKRLQSTVFTYRYTLTVGDGHISEFSVAGKTKALNTGKLFSRLRFWRLLCSAGLHFLFKSCIQLRIFHPRMEQCKVIQNFLKSCIP